MHAGVASNAYGVRGRVAIPRAEFVLPLVMGLVPFVLQSLPFHAHNKLGEGQVREADATAEHWLELYNPIKDSKHAPSPSNVFLAAVHHNMVQVSHLIISNLPSSDNMHFQQVWIFA